MPSKVANRSRGRARGAARLYGREDERAVLGAFLEQVRKAQSGALVLRGPAGIGKSALIADTVARANGFRIIAAEGAEPESGLAFASRRVGNWRSSSWAMPLAHVCVRNRRFRRCQTDPVPIHI